MTGPLPFELDSPELLEAVSAALAALTPAPAREPTAVSRRAENAPAYAVWQRESGDDPAALNASEALPEAETVFSWLDPAAISSGLSPEALSREIERDARRFE
jgi:hypothetical protein